MLKNSITILLKIIPHSKHLGLIFLGVFLFVASDSFAQEDKNKKKEQDRFLNYEEPDFLVDKDTVEVIKKKKKKRKKKTFNGLKTRRAFTKSGSGKGMTLELFYYLKKYKHPDKFVTPVYLFELAKLRIVEVKKYSKEKYPPKEYRILHGPYTKTKDTVTLAEGYFYIGTKHHRWYKYGRNEILLDKKVYHKGWPAESEISYYDAEKKNLREVVPIVHGEKSGTYVYYYENGNIKERGKYENNIKVGQWIEYYRRRNSKKRITQYAKNGYDTEFKPEVLKEWDEKGKLKGGSAKGTKKRKLGSGH